MIKRHSSPYGPIDSIRKSDDMFTKFALAQGFAGLESDAAYAEHVKTCRLFWPRLWVNDTIVRSLDVEIAMAYDSTKATKFLKRRNTTEVINYVGDIIDSFSSNNNKAAFYALDVNDVSSESFVPEAIEGKIVMLGYLGEMLGDPSSEDKFYTPLNKSELSRGLPDMFGLVIHANIVQMIISESWIDNMGRLSELVFAFFVTLLHIFVLLYTLSRFPKWFDVISILLIFVQLVTYAYLRIFAFKFYGYKIELIATIGCLTIASIVVSIFHSHLDRFFTKSSKHKRPMEDVEFELFSNHD